MSNHPSDSLPKRVSRVRYLTYLIITLLFPVALLGLVELGLRVARPGGGLPLFERAVFAQGDYLVASRTVGQRWFGTLDNPPSPAPEPFARVKPERGIRIFVLGESSTAGFPYPRNATFSRLLRDVLRDVMPGDSIEVINLGIAATNSFTMLDLAGEVAAQQPDAVLIYAGHNEYYGALGAASRVSIPGGAGAVRIYLRLLRLRTVLALRNGLAAFGGSSVESPTDLEAASLMEILARDRLIPFESARYEQGVRQFEANLAAIVRVFARQDIPVFIGSLVSNVRDQPPFAAERNHDENGAVPMFDSARVALAAGDTATAALLFSRARDLDVVRFRAPGEFNDAIRRVAGSAGATYVPVAEAFAAASPGGIPGSELLLEHVHPNRAGYALIGRVFFESLARSGVVGDSAAMARLRPWDVYAAGTTLTPFDDRVAFHLVRTLSSRWPFVPVERQSDYRGSYLPSDFLDSIAFAVSRGAPWAQGKAQLAAEYERRGQFDSAAAEYAGLARDAPFFDEPVRMQARALALAGKEAVERRELAEAISLFRRSLALQPDQPGVLYQLSLAYGITNDAANARATALQLARIAPNHPGLADWLATLGVRP